MDNQPAEYMLKIGRLIAKARIRRNMTQADLAAAVDTSQSAINRVERGKQNVSLETISRISNALDTPILNIASENAPQSYEINGGRKLHGYVTINTSKNAAVALLCACFAIISVES